MCNNSLYSSKQFGFMKERSCQLQLLESLEDWTCARDEKLDGDIIFYDFRKVFDTLSHERLIQKPKSYGKVGPTLKWIKEFLSERTQEVIINNTCSVRLSVKSGVSQGSVLGPTPDIVETEVTLFADDAKIYTTVNSDLDCDKLQRTTDNFCEWSHKWDLDFNTSKCKRLHLGKQTITKNYFMKSKELDRQLIFNVYGEKYRGVLIDNSLNFN